MAATKSYPTKLLSAFLFCCVFVISFLVLFKIADGFEKREINKDLLAFLPVIVVTPGRAQVVYHAELERFLKDNADASLLVPLSKLSEYRNQIQTNTRSMKQSSSLDQFSQLPWDADFTVEEFANRQSFKVSASGSDDYVNVGWYEATDRE